MDSSQFDAFTTALARSRRTLLGSAMAATGTAIGVTGMAGKKKKKKCKAPTTKCGKKACCQPGQVCTNGACSASATTTPAPATTTPKPFTAVSCGGPKDTALTGVARYAQVFEASGTGLIATASFEVNSIVINTPFAVEIRTTQNGEPTNTVLGTAVIFGLPASASPLAITATFAPKVAVEQGQLYALTITDVAKKGFAISVRSAGACPGTMYLDFSAVNTFAATTSTLVFSVSP